MPKPQPMPEAARVRSACLRDHGGDGPPAVLIPSLINPPDILDLDRDVSLADAIRGMKRRTLLLDWGAAKHRADLSVSGHIEQLLLPLLAGLGEPAALIGYCLGGTMAIAASNLAACDRVATLASPWHFSRYPAESRDALLEMWTRSRASALELGALPMEVLQAAFWSLDPERTVRKFAEFGALDPASPQAHRFVALEDWANEGEPLPYPAAQELIESLFIADLPGSGEWSIGGQAIADEGGCPALNILAARDRIAPAATAPAGRSVRIESGHVGMIVGSARRQLHAELAGFLDPACR